MAHPLWSDAGTWIALGATAASVAVALSLAFRRVLRQTPPASIPAPCAASTLAPAADPERRETP